MTLRAFAKRQNVTLRAVQKAVERGRLSKSVGTTPAGRPTIVDLQLAKKEWRDNAAKPTKSGTTQALAEAQSRVAFERARALKISNEQKVGNLIDVHVANRTSFESARVIRDAMLNIPSRLAAEIAAESDPGKVHLRLDAEIRLALEAVANNLAEAG